MDQDTLLLALDQGTTSTRAVVLDRGAQVVAVAQRALRQIYPRSGWVEHDPEEIWSATLDVVSEVLSEARIEAGGITALGITNQRETTILWERETGRPIHNAIVWQDRRTAGLCASDSKREHFYQALHELLDDGRPVLVFTEYADTMRYLRDSLQAHYGEALDDRILYAIRIQSDPSQGFSLCPADICQVPDGDEPAAESGPVGDSAKQPRQIEAVQTSAVVEEAVLRTFRAAALDIGGVEYLESARRADLLLRRERALELRHRCSDPRWLRPIRALRRLPGATSGRRRSARCGR